MGGTAGYGHHTSRCTYVHFEETVEGMTFTRDYCLICRVESVCRGFFSDDPCPLPQAHVSEERSRDPRLKVDCRHKIRHYQEPGFQEPATRDEQRARFWTDKERRYHYCVVCRRTTYECPLARGGVCSTPTAAAPLNDTDFIAIAWRASLVEGPPRRWQP